MQIEIRPAEAHHCAALAAHSSALPFLNNHALLAFAGGELAGFLFFQRLAPDELEILQLETLEPFRRSGVARALLHELRNTQPGVCFLEVRESNRPARLLYQTEGFIEAGVRKQYYSSPHESAIVLKLKLC